MDDKTPGGVNMSKLKFFKDNPRATILIAALMLTTLICTPPIFFSFSPFGDFTEHSYIENSKFMWNNIYDSLTGHYIMDYPITGLKDQYSPSSPFRINCRVKNHTDSTHKYQVKLKAFDGNGHDFSFNNTFTLNSGQYAVWTGTACPALDGYLFNYACLVNIKFNQVFWTESRFFEDALHTRGSCTCGYLEWIVPRWKKDYKANYVDLKLELYRDGTLIDSQHNRVHCNVDPYETQTPIIPSPTYSTPPVPTIPPYTPDPNNDMDGDGIVDSEDSCPHTKGTRNYNGCPPNDRDGDGILDDIDKCPDIFGLGDDGCPESKDIMPEEVGPFMYALVAVILGLLVLIGYWRLKK